jgi:hypothetical protein
VALIGPNDPRSATQVTILLRRGRGDVTSVVGGVATRKVTITLPEEQLDRVRGLVAAGEAPNVSAFVIDL